MNFKYLRYILLPAVLLSALFSCKVTKPYRQPDLKTINLYRDQNQTDTATIATMPWQTFFTDTILKNLINEGIHNNNNLKVAVQKIAEAQATLKQSKQAFLPNATGGVNVARQKLPAYQAVPGFDTYNSYQLSLSASWEADIWGQLSSANKVAYANLLQTDAAKRAVQTQLIADIANNYYNLLALDRELEITDTAVQFRIKDVETMKALKEGAVVTGASVVQSEANRYSAEVAVPDIKRSIRETENAIDLLLARPSGPIKRVKLNDEQPPASLMTGVPVQLLKNRPDVQQAEYYFMSAFQNTNLAHTYFYPQFTVTASGGFSNLTLKDFFINSIFYNIAAGLTQPIFNQGINKARLKTAQAQQLEAMYNYQQAILNAGSEVSNALYAYQSSKDKDEARGKQIAALVKSVDYTEQLLRYSSATNYIDVLTSEQSLLAARLSGVNDKLQQLQATVNLYRALGGGWR